MNSQFNQQKKGSQKPPQTLEASMYPGYPRLRRLQFGVLWGRALLREVSSTPGLRSTPGLHSKDSSEITPSTPTLLRDGWDIRPVWYLNYLMGSILLMY